MNAATQRVRGATALLACCSAGLLFVGCAEMPSGPAVAVMPGPYKPFEVFVQDDQLCRGWASHSIGIPGNEAAANAVMASTALGATMGALAGAAIGNSRDAGAGAVFGALTGAAIGQSQGNATAWSAQRRYDIAYQQCMYAKGNQVPAYGYRDPPRQTPPPPPPQR